MADFQKPAHTVWVYSYFLKIHKSSDLAAIKAQIRNIRTDRMKVDEYRMRLCFAHHNEKAESTFLGV
jgi:hypothetical protein